jgi:hypothetical protein
VNTADSAADTGAEASAAGAAAAAPDSMPDAFTNTADMHAFRARKAFDLTGDGSPETVLLQARGPRVDSAQVDLLILATNGDTLYHDVWNTQRYFQYEKRSSFTDAEATSKIVAHLQRVLSDSAFTSDGPPARLTDNFPDGIDHDAIRYDLKEATVRERHGLRPAQPLRGSMYDEMEKVEVPTAAIDSLAAELSDMPTFTYFAGGEVTSTIAWSAARNRFIRIFSCC